MSLKKVHDDQPKEFKFSTENIKKVEEILKKYPNKNKKSAVMPLLYLAQRQNQNWIPLSAMKYSDLNNMLLQLMHSLHYDAQLEVSLFE